MNRVIRWGSNILLCGLLGFLSTDQLQAETIRIPIGQQGATQQVTVPQLGMSKSAVEQQFGTPLKRQPARGTPPISRWEYNTFVVYFESNHVIHAVIKHLPRDTDQQ